VIHQHHVEPSLGGDMGMNEAVTSILPLILPLSVGGIGGFFIGYAFKKVYRPAIIVGAFIFSFLYMAYAKVISLNSGELETVSTFIVTFGSSAIALLTSSLLFMGGFAIGLISGIKKG
jgi:uncharacterized membrane protein (Fun14 family)